MGLRMTVTSHPLHDDRRLPEDGGHAALRHAPRRRVVREHLAAVGVADDEADLARVEVDRDLPVSGFAGSTTCTRIAIAIDLERRVREQQ